MPPLNQTNTAVILSPVAITLLFLRNRQIPLHQSSDFVLSLSNHPGSGTILLGIIACTVLLCTAGAVDISSNVSGIADSVLLFYILSSVILNDSSISSSTSIVSELCHTILSVHSLYYSHLYLVSGLLYLWSSTTILSCIFLMVSTV